MSEIQAIEALFPLLKLYPWTIPIISHGMFNLSF